MTRDIGDGYVQDVEILAPNQVQEQVQRPLEGLEKHLERVGRNVQVLRNLRIGLPLDDRKGHLGLLHEVVRIVGGMAGIGFQKNGFSLVRSILF
jgi:hypothetical protein